MRNPIGSWVFIHSINKHLLSKYSVLPVSTVLGAGNLTLNKRHMIYLLMEVQLSRHDSKAQGVGLDGQENLEGKKPMNVMKIAKVWEIPDN